MLPRPRETPDPLCRELDYTKGIITVRVGWIWHFCIRGGNMAEEDWSATKAWARATRERIGMT